MERLLRAAWEKKLDRVSAAYAVAGWLLVQGASIVFPVFDLPAWTLRIFIVAVVLGFPAALVIAWFATSSRPVDDAISINISHREIILFALLGVVLLLSIGELVIISDHSTSPQGAGMNRTAQASIAVLPFVNMSGDPARDIVSDGISEELLDDLSDIAALRVAARTSSFAFKGKNEDIKEIARVLGVRTILQGSIREDGTHIRIAAQLIDAANGYDMWSETFDREMTGILTLEDDISRAITSALTHKLLGSRNTELAGKPASIDPIAYRTYLEGQHELGPRTAQGVTKAVALFKRVTTLQPDFADGFAALGRALINEAENNPTRQDLMPEAEAALARALALDPDNIAALGAHVDLALHKQDWEAAGVDAARMNAINAHSATVLHEMFRYYQLLGFPERALEAAQGAAKLDPLSVVDRLNVVSALIHIARYSDAASAAEAALALYDDQPYIRAMLCTAYAHSARIPQARAIATRLIAEHDTTDATGCAVDIAVGGGRLADARKILDGLAARFPNSDMSATDLGDSYATVGDNRDALIWLQRGYEAREFALVTIPLDRAIPPTFFDDPGWKSLAERPVFREWQKAHDKLAPGLGTK